MEIYAAVKIIWINARFFPTTQTLLYKFVRESGDHLAQILYVPYLRMLNGLASNKQGARAAFEMLRLNSAANNSE